VQGQKGGRRNDPADSARSEEVIMVAGMGRNADERRGGQVVTLAAQASGSSQAVSLQTARSFICSSTTVVFTRLLKPRPIPHSGAALVQ
jgi:hypothetical protein